MDTDYRQTLDVRELRPRLRSNVECQLATYGLKRCYIVEDLATGRFFRIGYPEYALISQFDGRTTLQTAISRLATSIADAALSEQEAVIVCRWLLDSGLAVLEDLPAPDDSGESSFQPLRHRRWLQAANPLTPRLALLNPDSLLQSCRFAGRLLCSPYFLLVWLAVVATGAYFCWADFEKIVGDAGLTAVSPHDIAIFAAVWLLLKFVHEAGHAFACRWCGGRVVEAGVMFILLVPLPYVDVTSAWRIRSRWKRACVAAAGMYLEIFCAALAAVILHSAVDPVVVQICRYVVISAGVTTVLFNANPLMKFDGYFILSDGFNLPNLAVHSQEAINWLLKRIFFGPGRHRRTWPEGADATLLIYGFLSAVWRVLICISLAAGAALLLHGAGIVIAAIAIVLWVLKPVFSLVCFFPQEVRVRPLACARCLVLTAILAGAISVVATMPLTYGVEAPAVVDFRPVTEIRPTVRGFVKTVHCTAGDTVVAGDVLVSLTNPELFAEAKRLELQIRQSEARARQHRTEKKLAAMQIDLRDVESMQSRLAVLSNQQDELEIRAPVTGRVIQADLQTLTGRLVLPGQKLLTVAGDDTLTVKVMIPQTHERTFRHADDLRVSVHVNGCGIGWEESHIRLVSPGAQTRLPHPAFGAQFGGDMTIVYSEQQSDTKAAEDYVAAEPHFLSLVDIPAAYQGQVYAGQTASVLVARSTDTVGNSLHRWCRRVVQQYLIQRDGV